MQATIINRHYAKLVGLPTIEASQQRLKAARPQQDEHDEFNADFEAMRVATGPHLPLSLAQLQSYRDSKNQAVAALYSLMGM